MTLRSMAATQATTATTLNPSPDRTQAAGRNTKWKLGEPTPAPLKYLGIPVAVFSYLLPNNSYRG
ncbi:MAG TPA: hypothetical protein VG075_10535 [Candidatus Acidoferrum sp.]|nr:hypothetical protein [Candidatus Acidoferrum sp.]